MESSDVNSRISSSRAVKVLAAAIGACGVVAMGALTLVVAGTEAHATPPTIATGSGSGETVTMGPDTPAPVATAPPVPWAVPNIKSAPFQGKGWPGMDAPQH